MNGNETETEAAHLRDQRSQARTGLEQDQLASLTSLIPEMRRFGLSLISVQSDLAAKLHQPGQDFSQEIHELGNDVLEIYEDLEALAKDFADLLQINEFEEFEEVLEDFEECLAELHYALPKLEQHMTAHDEVRISLGEEFYLG